MARFEPFAALRYDPGVLASRGMRLEDVVAPPYDVVGPEERAILARCELNAVRLDLPEPDAEQGLDRYQSAASLLARWQAEGVLKADAAPVFYGYAMSFTGPDGQQRRSAGVIGALQVAAGDANGVLAHERTLPKPRSDRLDLLRATRANTSPVWGLSLARGLSELIGAAAHGEADAVGATAPGAAGTAVGACAVVEDVRHDLWEIRDPKVCSAIAKLVASEPVVLADGHHRYETACAFLQEEESLGEPGGAASIMALVMELSEDQLAVGAIHRLVLAPAEGLVALLERHFELQPAPGEGVVPGEELERAGAPLLLTRAGRWWLRALPPTVEAAEDDLDSSRLEVALGGSPGVDIEHCHTVAEASGRLERGEAAAAILLRPATVPVIAAAARARRRFPPKTTYFWPKPRSGMAFRLLRA